MTRALLLTAIAALTLATLPVGEPSAEAHPRHLHFFGGKSLEYYGSHGHYRVCRNKIVEYIPYRWHHKKGYWPVYGKRCHWIRTCKP